jgi:hypothetical protein
LGLVRVGVEALVADLDSVDAVEEEVRPLRDLVDELRVVAGPRVPGREALGRLRERALAVLRAFAAPGHRQPPGQTQPPGQGQPPGPALPPVTGQPRDSGFWRR